MSGILGTPDLLDQRSIRHVVSLTNRLRIARAEQGLSQERLAELAGVTRQTISSIETGQYVPSALLAFVLARRLHMEVDELFTLTGDDP